LKYLSGEEVMVGDIVLVAFKTAADESRVKLVLVAGSAEAIAWNAPEGGVLIESEATGLVLWRAPDEDMEFVRRGHNEQIAASIQVREHQKGGYVIRIGEAVVLELMPLFQLEGSYSNGPAWGALIEYVVSSDPRSSDYELDSEGLGWSQTREPLDRLRSILLEAAADPAKLRKLIRDGRAAGFGHGDL
jgi:hypothetical protein